jgi:hypothetical protein
VSQLPANDPMLHALTRAEHDAVYRQRIRPVLIQGRPFPSPRVTILGGQPGSGKSFAMAGLPESQRTGVVIASDRLRVHHPLWPDLLRWDDTTAGFYTSHDARGWVADAIADAISERLNVVFDTASDDPDRVRQIIGQFRDGGYGVDVLFVSTASAVSRLSVLSRYQDERDAVGGGRFVDNPDQSHPGVLATAAMIDRERLADTVTVTSRTRQLYRNELGPDGQWLRLPGTAATIQTERERAWTPAETENFRQAADSLVQRMGPRWQVDISAIVRSARPLMHPAATAAHEGDATSTLRGAMDETRDAQRGRPAAPHWPRAGFTPGQEPDMSPEAEP